MNESSEGGGMTFKVREVSNKEEVTVFVGVNGAAAGHIQFVRVFTRGMRGFLGNVAPCKKDFEKLIGDGHSGEFIYFVSFSKISPQFKGMGWGKKMYAGGFKELRSVVGGPLFVIPNNCEGRFDDGTGTSSDARRVWESLANDYPSSGNVFYLE